MRRRIKTQCHDNLTWHQNVMRCHNNAMTLTTLMTVLHNTKTAFWHCVTFTTPSQIVDIDDDNVGRRQDDIVLVVDATSWWHSASREIFNIVFYIDVVDVTRRHQDVRQQSCFHLRRCTQQKSVNRARHPFELKYLTSCTRNLFSIVTCIIWLIIIKIQVTPITEPLHQARRQG